MSRALIAMLAAAAVATPAVAQDADKVVPLLNNTSGNTDIFAYDFGPPKSPAMTLLGLDADASPPSTSLKAFVVSASNLANGGGASAALDISLAKLFGGGSNFDDYVDGTDAHRLLRRTRFGIAALNGSPGADPVRSGISAGFSVSLLNASDPLKARFQNSRTGENVQLKQCMLPSLQSLSNLLDLAKFYDAAVAADPTLPEWIDSGRAATIILTETGSARGATLDEQLAGYNKALQQLKRTDSKSRLPAEFNSLDSGATLVAVKAARQALAAFIAEAFAKPLAAQAAAFDKRKDVLALRAEIDRCAKRASAAASFGADLDLGFGTFWRGKPGEFAELKNGGTAVWAAVQLPLNMGQRRAPDGTLASVLMAAASVRYGHHESVDSGDAVIPDIRADTLNGWLGIEWRSETLLTSLRYGYQQVRANDAVGQFYNRSGDRFLAQAQIRMGGESPLWLGLAYGNAGGTVDSYNAKRLLVTLAFSPPKPDNITGIKD